MSTERTPNSVLICGIVVFIVHTVSSNDCFTVYQSQTIYRGNASKTGRGSCLAWTANIAPIPNAASIGSLRQMLNRTEGRFDHNFCRSFPPDVAHYPQPWCFVAPALQMSSNIADRWAYCTDPQPCQQCFVAGTLYRGNVSHSISGASCLFWNDSINESATQLQLIRNELTMNEGFYNHNFCRNPTTGGIGQPWCYTGYNQWEYCAVPACAAGDNGSNTMSQVAPMAAAPPPVIAFVSASSSCNASAPVPNGRLLPNCSGLPGTQCAVSCSPGFVAAVNYVLCQSTFQWDPPVNNLCVAQCTADLPNGQLHSQCSRQVGAVCSYQCSTQLDSQPPGQIICLDGGVWNWDVTTLCPGPKLTAFVGEWPRKVVVTVVVCAVAVVVVKILIGLIICCRCAMRKRRTTPAAAAMEPKKTCDVQKPPPTAPIILREPTAVVDLPPRYSSLYGAPPSFDYRRMNPVLY